MRRGCVCNLSPACGGSYTSDACRPCLWRELLLRWTRVLRHHEHLCPYLRSPSSTVLVFVLVFMTIFGVQLLQFICTVAFDHSRTKTPLPLAVSAHSPLGTP
mmetsp:Transcript_40722/g.112006  ORF Transcript_40722/g.112006 Transcript_40722/m.112006 type:complete len:102 (-) Transcript_40722:288-593(-)